MGSKREGCRPGEGLPRSAQDPRLRGLGQQHHGSDGVTTRKSPTGSGGAMGGSGVEQDMMEEPWARHPYLFDVNVTCPSPPKICL